MYAHPDAKVTLPALVGIQRQTDIDDSIIRFESMRRIT